MKSIIGMIKFKASISEERAKHPKNQKLLDEAMAKVEFFKHSISDRMVWESYAKQIKESEKAI